MKFKKPIHLIRHYKYLEKKKLSICDGCTTNMDVGINIFYPLFIITGLALFLNICIHWDEIKFVTKYSIVTITVIAMILSLILLNPVEVY
jgi:hypothetical protein